MNPPGESSAQKGRGRAIWRQGQDHKELRRPQAENRIGHTTNSNNTQPDAGAEGDIPKTSTLSATAKEFYPKSYQSQQLEDCYNSSQYEEALPEGGDCSRFNSLSSASETTHEQLATNHLVEVMQHLTLNPGRFDVLITPLVDTFSLWLGDSDTMSSIVNAIVEQSITEPNFRYNGARLCNFLNNEFPPGERSTFRASLLTRCREEHLQMGTFIHADARRLHGYVLFMAELFLQLEVLKDYGQRIIILGTALLEALALLLTEPTSENIKCVCQVLKLTGQPLDAQDRIKMNGIMQSLLLILSNPVVESNIRHLISSVIELRNAAWGNASNCMPHASTTQLYNPCPQNEPVFYGPDGQIMTPEESQFLQESVGRITDAEEYDDYGEDGDAVWEPDDEMDEEIQAAFEQFLEMGKNQSKDTNATTGNKCNG